MTVLSQTRAPVWFTVAAWLALLWNVFGVFMYLSSVGLFGDPMAGLDEADRAAAEAIPDWITGAFALGTLSGLLGSLGLVLRRAWAQPVLIVSMIALLVLEGWIVFFSGTLESFGLAVPIMVSLVAILLVWLAGHGRRRAWLA